MNQVRSLREVIAEGLDGYAGLFFPGGHAPAVDPMQDADAEVGTILRYFLQTEIGPLDKCLVVSASRRPLWIRIVHRDHCSLATGVDVFEHRVGGGRPGRLRLGCRPSPRA